MGCAQGWDTVKREIPAMPHSNLAQIETLPIDPHRHVVGCPRQGRDVAVDACRDCVHCWIVHSGAGPGGGFVICETLPAEAPRRAGASMAEARTTPVSAIMTRPVISVRATLAIERLILLLIDSGIGAAPVVDEAARPIGLVSRDDLVTDDYDWADLRDDFLSYPRSADLGDDALFLPELLRSRTVADVMQRRLVTLGPDASVAEAAAALDGQRAHEAIVVDHAGAMVGVVS